MIIHIALAFWCSFFLFTLMVNRYKKYFVGRVREHLTVGTHQQKKNIPSFGGIVFFILLPLLYTLSQTPNAIFISIVTLISGGIGIIDDWKKKVTGRGISVKKKFVTHTIAVGIAVLFWCMQRGSFVGTLSWGHYEIPLSIGYIPWCILVIIATTHAVNLTDGIDGLAGTQSLIVLAGVFLRELIINRGTPNEVTSAILIMGAILFAFLLFNWHPARLFMGDGGSFFLGGLISTIFIIRKSELLLMISGGVFVIETLSVIAQYLSITYRKKRLPLLTPLHHELEARGYREKRIVKIASVVGILLQISLLFF